MCIMDRTSITGKIILHPKVEMLQNLSCDKAVIFAQAYMATSIEIRKTILRIDLCRIYDYFEADRC